MKQKNDRYGLYMPLYLLLAILATLLRSIATLRDLDPATGYYQGGLHRVSAWIAFGAVALLFSFAFFHKKPPKLLPTFVSPLTYVPAGVVSVSMFAMGVYLLITLGQASSGAVTMLGYPTSILRIFVILTAVCALLGLFYFVFCMLREEPGHRARAEFGMVSTFFFALYAVYLYFNTVTPLNDPNKLVFQMAYIFTAMFFLYETRISLEREKWHLYGAFGFCAGLLCLYASVPALLSFLIQGKIITDNMYSAVLLFLMFVFISCRLFLVSGYKEAHMDPMANRLIAFCKGRKPAVETAEQAEATPSAQLPTEDEEPAQATEVPQTDAGEERDEKDEEDPGH